MTEPYQLRYLKRTPYTLDDVDAILRSVDLGNNLDIWAMPSRVRQQVLLDAVGELRDRMIAEGETFAEVVE
jgi:hypothetical protein